MRAKVILTIAPSEQEIREVEDCIGPGAWGKLSALGYMIIPKALLQAMVEELEGDIGEGPPKSGTH